MASKDSALPVGEHAHIVAEERRGPRGDSPLTLAERNSYANLILLCPSCHTKVDKVPKDFPVERLHHLKVQHELWVAESLSDAIERTDPADLLYSDLVDHITTAAKLDAWRSWTSLALSPNQIWPGVMNDNVFELRQRIQCAIWPGKFDELERSMQTFVELLGAAFDLFSEHCSRISDELHADCFYKIHHWNPELYRRLAEEYKSWTLACDELIRESTRAANWFADCVRRDLNPKYLLFEGRLALLRPQYHSRFNSELLTYTNESTRNLPKAIPRRIKTIKKQCGVRT